MKIDDAVNHAAPDLAPVPDDDEPMARAAVCEYIGGKGKPLNPSTLHKLIAKGLFPKPYRIGLNSVRWLKSEVAEARRQMLATRDEPAPFRRRGRKGTKTNPHPSSVEAIEAV